MEYYTTAVRPTNLDSSLPLEHLKVGTGTSGDFIRPVAVCRSSFCDQSAL